MDRDTLLNAVRVGHVEVSMNDGQNLVIPSPEFCLVDDVAAHVLYRADDGSWKTMIGALVCMTTTTPIETQPS